MTLARFRPARSSSEVEKQAEQEVWKLNPLARYALRVIL
jgi:hypothetical protein